MFFWDDDDDWFADDDDDGCTSHTSCGSGQYCDSSRTCYACDYCWEWNDAFDGACPSTCGSTASCTAAGGTCQDNFFTCNDGRYVPGRCPGPADFQCCIPYDDRQCTSDGGRCVDVHQSSCDGFITYGDCDGGSERRCCRSCHSHNDCGPSEYCDGGRCSACSSCWGLTPFPNCPSKCGTDSLCHAAGGQCGGPGTCGADFGRQQAGLCAGGADRQCCVPYDDGRCDARGGRCTTTLPCAGGLVMTYGDCGGDAERRCCSPCTHDGECGSGRFCDASRRCASCDACWLSGGNCPATCGSDATCPGACTVGSAADNFGCAGVSQAGLCAGPDERRCCFDCTSHTQCERACLPSGACGACDECWRQGTACPADRCGSDTACVADGGTCGFVDTDTCGGDSRWTTFKCGGSEARQCCEPWGTQDDGCATAGGMCVDVSLAGHACSGAQRDDLCGGSRTCCLRCTSHSDCGSGEFCDSDGECQACDRCWWLTGDPVDGACPAKCGADDGCDAAGGVCERTTRYNCRGNTHRWLPFSSDACGGAAALRACCAPYDAGADAHCTSAGGTCLDRTVTSCDGVFREDLGCASDVGGARQCCARCSTHSDCSERQFCAHGGACHPRALCSGDQAVDGRCPGQPAEVPVQPPQPPASEPRDALECEAAHRVPRVGSPPASNGCGPMGTWPGMPFTDSTPDDWLQQLFGAGVAAGMAAVIPDWFGVCCPQHDVCFGSCGARFTAASCNDAFLSCTTQYCLDALSRWLLEHSVEKAHALYTRCAIAARTYYSVVDSFGTAHFATAQQQHCTCPPAAGRRLPSSSDGDVLGATGAVTAPASAFYYRVTANGGVDVLAHGYATAGMAPQVTVPADADGLLMEAVVVGSDGTATLAAASDDAAAAQLAPVYTWVPQDNDHPDNDGDGLADVVEAVIGTDPAVADTDGDGTADGVEVATPGRNPLVPDAPALWPLGQYCMPALVGGCCPPGFRMGTRAYSGGGTVTGDPDALPWRVVAGDHAVQVVCCKDDDGGGGSGDDTGTSASGSWMSGRYALWRAPGRRCPAGFQDGAEWRVTTAARTGSRVGVLPDGTYGPSVTVMHPCWHVEDAPGGNGVASVAAAAPVTLAVKDATPQEVALLVAVGDDDAPTACVQQVGPAATAVDGRLVSVALHGSSGTLHYCVYGIADGP